MTMDKYSGGFRRDARLNSYINISQLINDLVVTVRYDLMTDYCSLFPRAKSTIYTEVLSSGGGGGGGVRYSVSLRRYDPMTDYCSLFPRAKSTVFPL